MKLTLGGTAAAIALMWSASAGAAVVNFADLENEFIPTTYQGLVWQNWAADTAAADGTGYEWGLNGSPSVAYNRSGTPADIGMITQPFNFDGAYFNAAFKDGLQITINGYDGVDLVHSITLTVDVQTPFWFDADWGHITNLSFSSMGGTPREDLFFIDANQFVMSNFTWSESATPAPEPATWAMMILGFGAVGSAMRRRRLVPA